jgi:mannose-1-phosphate guanylyltransferase
VRLFDGQSLFQKTLQRNAVVCDGSLVITNTEQYFLAVDQVGQNQASACGYLLEPHGRNTAPAIALACMALDADELVLVTPSDHLVENQANYEVAVAEAARAAEAGRIITFGVKPSYAETGFGYIEATNVGVAVSDVVSFHEKPDEKTAEAYLAQGNFYWNAGLFCFKAGVFLAELEAHSPAIYKACRQAHATAVCENSVTRIDPEAMLAIPEDSIDYAVMERSNLVQVVASDMGWSDLGSYDALYEESQNAAQDNVVMLVGDKAQPPISVDSRNNLVVARDNQVALIDVENLLVVDTSDALLICQRGSSQKVKQVVSQLRQERAELTDIHRLAYRPWGTYEVLVDSEGYKVKRIIVKPGQRLSLQKHFHRNEHWVVVSGTAMVTVDDDKFELRENESTYIKMGQVHRLENQGSVDLVMVEVQVGEYTGEDDIVRIEDSYSRQ